MNTVLWMKLRAKLSNRIEKIFRRKRLAYLEAQNKLLADMNMNLVTGDSVRLTFDERKLLLNAIEAPHFKDRIELPQTKRYIRIVRNNLREKMRASLKEGR